MGSAATFNLGHCSKHIAPFLLLLVTIGLQDQGGTCSSLGELQHAMVGHRVDLLRVAGIARASPMRGKPLPRLRPATYVTYFGYFVASLSETFHHGLCYPDRFGMMIAGCWP